MMLDVGAMGVERRLAVPRWCVGRVNDGSKNAGHAHKNTFHKRYDQMMFDITVVISMKMGAHLPQRILS